MGGMHLQWRVMLKTGCVCTVAVSVLDTHYWISGLPAREVTNWQTRGIAWFFFP